MTLMFMHVKVIYVACCLFNGVAYFEFLLIFIIFQCNIITVPACSVIAVLHIPK